MRNRYALLLAIVLCVSGLLLHGQSAKRNARSRSSARNTPTLYVPIESINVDMNLVRPPNFITDNKKSRIGANEVPDSFRLWLMADISFSISYRPGKKSLPLPLEKLKVELYLYAPGPARDGVSFRWFCGVQNLQCVVADPDLRQRKYWASLFLPSSYVYLHVPQERGRLSLRGVEGIVIIADKENNILGRKVFGYGARTKLPASRVQPLAAAATQLRGKKTKNQVMLWPREKTPWHWLDADRFELPLTDLTTKPQEVTSQPLPPAQTDGIEE